MKTSYLNCCNVLTWTTLIAIPITIFILSPAKKGHEQNVYFKDANQINTSSESLENNLCPRVHNASLPKDCNNLNVSSKSKTNFINPSEILSLNLNGKNNNDGHIKPNESDILLYRKRRYLLFPEGSSFQIVFDLIIPIVDYTNYAIMGITCAVAWELPSKPPSEIEQDLVDKLNDGTFGLSRNDSIDNIKYVDTPHHKKNLKDHLSKIIYIQPSEYEYHSPSGNKASYNQPQTNSIDRKEYNNNGKYRPRPVYPNNQQKQSLYYQNPYNAPFKLKSINNERIDLGTSSETLWKSRFAKRPDSYKEPSQSRPRNTFPKRKQHAVYHIMGKRSTPRATSAADSQSKTENPSPLLEKLERIHLRYHRTSRHALYSKVEAMLNTKGKNGTECILRALCETGQKRHETEPGGLVAEILRAIFTLPEADAETRTKEYHSKHKAWDDAHWHHRNCSDTYPLCEDFIWNSK